MKKLMIGIASILLLICVWHMTEPAENEPPTWATESESHIKWKDPDVSVEIAPVQPEVQLPLIETETTENETVIPGIGTEEAEIETEIVETETVVPETETEPYFYLSDQERYIVECIVMGESGGEPYEGQVLVAQCILNGCLKEDVQPSKLRKMYRYSGYRTNVTQSVKKAVRAVFDEGYKITDEPILYFYAPKHSKGKWHETQCFVIEVGGHRFFKDW